MQVAPTEVLNVLKQLMEDGRAHAVYHQQKNALSLFDDRSDDLGEDTLDADRVSEGVRLGCGREVASKAAILLFTSRSHGVEKPAVRRRQRREPVTIRHDLPRPVGVGDRKSTRLNSSHI